jgi:hypothetical protein
VHDASLTLVSADPAGGAGLVKGRTQRFVFRFRYESNSRSTVPPLFLVAHLRQLQGQTVVDDPPDFHFPTPTLSGDVDAVIERALRRDADRLEISWVLAAQDPNVPVPGPVLPYTLID